MQKQKFHKETLISRDCLETLSASYLAIIQITESTSRVSQRKLLILNKLRQLSYHGPIISIARGHRRKKITGNY